MSLFFRGDHDRLCNRELSIFGMWNVRISERVFIQNASSLFKRRTRAFVYQIMSLSNAFVVALSNVRSSCLSFRAWLFLIQNGNVGARASHVVTSLAVFKNDQTNTRRRRQFDAISKRQGETEQIAVARASRTVILVKIIDFPLRRYKTAKRTEQWRPFPVATSWRILYGYYCECKS